VVYTAGDGDLVDNADGTWTLTIPVGDALPEAIYDVTATITDAAGNLSTDPSSSELTVDLTAPGTPTVHSQLTNNQTPIITGTASVNSGDTLSVEVNGVVYISGDGNLIANADGTWTLTVPPTDALAEGAYDVTVIVVDLAGNSSTDVTVDELTIDLTTPVAPIPTLTADANNDALLNAAEAINPQPVDIALPAGAEIGDALTLDDGITSNNFVLSATDITTGLITTVVTLPSDGTTLTVTAQLTDQAGNVSPTADDSALVDATGPGAPIIEIAEDVNDDGFINAAESNSLVDIVVTLPANATVGDELTVEIDGIVTTQVLTVADVNAGVVNLTSPVPAQGATIVATAFIIDPSGNTSPTADDEADLDVLVPVVPSVNTLTTNTGTPVITGTAVVVPNDILTVTVNGVTYTAGDGNLVINSGGIWSLTIPTADALADNIYDVSVSIADTAGNVSMDISTDELIVDLGVPSIPTVDTLLTNLTTPTLTGTATVTAGETFTVTVDGVTYTNGDGNLVLTNSGDWTLTVPAGNAIADGTYEVIATVTDAAGNVSTDVTADELVVDSTPPAIPTAESQLTNNANPILLGTATVASGEVLTVTVNGVSYTAGDGNLIDNSDGTWSLTIPPSDALVDGTYEVVVTITDAAGNATVDTTVDELVVDLTNPSAPGVTSQSTQDTTPVISGITPVAPDLTLSVSVNGITYTAGDGNLVVNADGTWDLTIPAADAMADGLYQVLATVTDAAGNSTSDGGVDELMIDTVAPPSPGVTSLVTNNVTPILSGTANVSAGDTLTVEVNGVVYTAGDGNLVDNNDGSWTLTIPVSDALPEAIYDVTVLLSDSAGNTSTDPSSQELTIDLNAPGTPTVHAQVSNSALPVVTGTATVSPDDTITVVVNGVVYVAGDGNLVINSDGTWSLTIPPGDDLAEGVYAVTVTVTDLAGNSSIDSTTDELEIDLTLPVAPTVNAQQINTGTPTITGTATVLPGEIFTVTVNGVVYTAGDGNLVLNADGSWVLIIPTADALAEGTYEVIATVTDAAGNSISDASIDELSIDLTPPNSLSFVDQLSNTGTPNIGGTVSLQAGETFSVTVKGVTYTVGDGFLTIDANGNWNLMIDPDNALPDGVYDVTLTVEDAAGNVVSNSPGEQLTIDTNAPDLDANDLGVVADYRPTLSGTTSAADGSTVTITDASGNVVCTAVVTNGQWSCQPQFDLAEGPHQFTAEVIDPAGNAATVLIDVTVSSDFDGDGIPNSVEGFGDSDGDGVPDSVDLDSDNDGIPDANESLIDSDGDGVPNYLDGDADNDGMADLIEAEGVDTDGSFAVDNFFDKNSDGLSDELAAFPLAIPDTDADGIPDYLDVDADNDGIPDLLENQGTDVEINGRIDGFSDADGNGVDDGVQAVPVVVMDSDNDGMPDYLDLDSDNDGESDLLETRGFDADIDLIVDEMRDADSDGIPDSVDFSVIGGVDADSDGIEDSADVDFVSGPDTDGDGIVDASDPDADGDGFYDDAVAGAGFSLPDLDADGIPDFQQAVPGALRTGINGRGGCAMVVAAVR